MTKNEKARKEINGMQIHGSHAVFKNQRSAINLTTFQDFMESQESLKEVQRNFLLLVSVLAFPRASLNSYTAF